MSTLEKTMAGLTGLEPATSGVTGRHSNQLSYNPLLYLFSAVMTEGAEEFFLIP